MDPLAVAAEIAGVLQTAETVPSIRRRRASRQERREAYLAYQREVYRLMAAVNYVSSLAQTDMDVWQTMMIAAIPVAQPFIDLVASKPSKNALINWTQELAHGTVPLLNAITPSAEAALASTYTSRTQLRERAFVEVAALRDVTAEYLSALGRVRLLGRPDAVAAAGVIRGLFQELFERFPAQPNL